MKRVLLAFVFLPLLLLPQALDPSQDFLLLHNGDLLLVEFPQDGSGQLQFYSLTPSSRVDLSFSREKIEQLMFTREQGWTAYPGDLRGAKVQIVLRESGGDPLPQIPGNSDLVVRVINGRVKVALHADNDQRGERGRTGEVLDW